MSSKLAYGLMKAFSQPNIRKQLEKAGAAVVTAAAPVVVSSLPVLIPAAIIAAGTAGAFAIGNAISKNKKA